MYEITSLRQATTLGEEVVRRLRYLVITGRLAPGTHLVEDRLAREFDISRGPIRDALRKLEGEGLLESRRRGLFVVGLDESDVEELYTLRESLESLALRRSMERATPEDWATLQGPIDAMRDAADRGSAEDFASADLEFHSRFYELSGHRRLVSVWEQYRPTFSVLLSVTNAQDADLHPSAEAHVALLEGVRSGDVESTVRELSAHLLGAKNRMRAARAKGAH
ncbi:FCD domain-containing protein [Nonomuraea phyllanthi]|uniref:FCD domain-containing protein n=1 Tax=Nonomuraea phyllanthi TaxID=2219224 RepID=A0A5C4VPI0_9ACTN|nr:GntR family transcriptional regulator [Nonomuraea phyllanthi]KAB8189628.1 FCD domain-containing protein [Nonomuraea phyllanthi]QFY12019.1 FCD domain-containing protein [Nonomuraea phyllanthi]